jgi:antitoxin component of MazEF toxin-antitoxin module
MSITRSIKLRKAGGSLIATIPKDIVERKQLRAGDIVPVEFKDDDELWAQFYGSFPMLTWDRNEIRGPDRF